MSTTPITYDMPMSGARTCAGCAKRLTARYVGTGKDRKPCCTQCRKNPAVLLKLGAR